MGQEWYKIIIFLRGLKVMFILGPGIFIRKN